MSKELLPWLVLFAPLAAAAVITIFPGANRRLSGGISIAAVVLSFLLSLALVGWVGWSPAPFESAVTWLDIGNFHVDLGLRLDALSILMMVMVTGVAAAIHIYSWGYMGQDPQFSRFFASLGLFTFSMLGIV